MNEPTCLSTGTRMSADEKTIDFQGRHKDKHKIKHKREGDGFTYDFYCDNIFAHYFHFRNMPPPMKHVRLKLSA